MHFFIDYDLLADQSASGDSYGPTSSPFDEWDVAARFDLSTEASAFACQAGRMIVLPYYDVDTTSIDTSLVNVIIKPSSGLDIKFPRVKYYIYRGIKIESILTSSGAFQADGSTNNELTERIWIDKNNLQSILGTTLPDPDPKDLGYDPTLSDSIHIEDIFNNSQAPVKSHDIKEGEFFGKFGTAKKIAFEIIVDSDPIVVNVGYCKKSYHIVDISSLTGISSPSAQDLFDLKTAREQILAWVDPAAFFGNFYYAGVRASKFSGVNRVDDKKKKQTLYDDLLDGHFATKNRVYLDIRSENGYSYNFYENYKDTTNNDYNLKVQGGNATSFLTQFYHTANWPIFYDANWVGPDKRNQVDIQLRVDDNTKPLLYFLEPKFKTKARRKKFIDDQALLNGSNTDWTNTIRLRFPNGGSGPNKYNIAQWIRMQYFRQEDNASSPTTVIKRGQNMLDTVWGGIVIPDMSFDSPFQHSWQSKAHFVKGDDFSFVPQTGAYFDTSLVVLYAENVAEFQKNRGNRYPRWNQDEIPFNDLGVSPVLPKEMVFSKWQIEVTAGNYIDILEISGFNRGAKRAQVNDLFFLGLTDTEFTTLKNLSGLDSRHQKYLVLDETTGLSDINGMPYRKYELKLQGLDDTGNIPTAPIASGIEVYGGGGNILCSAAFAASPNLPTVLPDPGLMQQWDHVYTFKYDQNDSFVTGLFTGGEAIVDDEGNNLEFDDPMVEMRAMVSMPIDTPGDTTPSARLTNYPLVVIVHGNGHDYRDYQWLLEHLARNGFLAASVDCTIRGNIPEIPAGGYAPYTAYIPTTVDTYLYDPTVPELAVYNEATNSATSTVLTDGVDFKVIPGGFLPDRITFLKEKYYSHGMASEGRTNVLFKHLKILQSILNPHVQDNIGIMGHSRGGEAVVRAADLITGALAHPSLKTITAVMSLAPTDQYEEESLVKNIPYYVLYGSKDGDVSGVTAPRRFAGSAAIPTESGAFSLYDRAQNSTTKSMSFVYRATHNGFITDNHDYPGGFLAGTISPTKQQRIARAYTNAFFRQHLKSESIWAPYFYGEQIPNSANFRKIYPQYQDMGAPAEVVDNFESGTGWTVASNTEAVSHSRSGVSINEGVLDIIDNRSPHVSQGILIEWEGDDIMTFTVNPSGLDVSGLTHFSMRISHKVKNPNTGYESLEEMEVALKDTSGNEFPVKLNREIPRPGNRNDEERIKSALTTVRLPLIDYSNGGVNLSSVKEVKLIFPKKSDAKGTIDIDDLEFTN